MDIRTFRKKHKLTQAAFAVLVSKHGQPATQSLVSQWETGEVVLTADRCVQIERATRGAVGRSQLRADLWPARTPPPRRLAADPHIP